MPQYLLGIPFLWNKALFKKAGLDPNKGPKTWAEFNSACEKLVKAGLICIAHGSADWTDATTFDSVVYGLDLDLYRKAFVQADLMRLPFADACAGAVIAEGVLHHTPSTKAALEALVRLVEPGGELLFYVYRRKGPIREFADDHIRDQLSVLSPEVALEQLRSLTEFGRALAELRTDVTVPDVPLLGIQGGRYDIQRLFYWNVAKAFWNDSMSFEENLHINFDWYHPRYAHRQSDTEVRAWCEEAGLTIERFHAEEAGFTVHARRP